jgi:hypothetical protein
MAKPKLYLGVPRISLENIVQLSDECRRRMFRRDLNPDDRDLCVLRNVEVFHIANHHREELLA